MSLLGTKAKGTPRSYLENLFKTSQTTKYCENTILFVAALVCSITRNRNSFLSLHVKGRPVVTSSTTNRE